jgi:acyl-CoA reductase-like NAD-dependent aldehyde dehydrogenase
MALTEEQKKNLTQEQIDNYEKFAAMTPEERNAHYQKMADERMERYNKLPRATEEEVEKMMEQRYGQVIETGSRQDF